MPDHVRNFLDCIKSRQDPVAPVEIGHRSATVCHLGNIAMQLRRKLRWDPVQESFVDDDQANQMLLRPLRALEPELSKWGREPEYRVPSVRKESRPLLPFEASKCNAVNFCRAPLA